MKVSKKIADLAYKIIIVDQPLNDDQVDEVGIFLLPMGIDGDYFEAQVLLRDYNDSSKFRTYGNGSQGTLTEALDVLEANIEKDTKQNKEELEAIKLLKNKGYKVSK